MTNLTVKFRPHHFLCTLCFQGEGYSSQFVMNYVALKKNLEAHPDTLIEVVSKTTDDICSPCPHHQSDHTCATEEKIQSLDTRHAVALNLKAGDVLSWKEAKELMAEKIDLAQFHKICEGCSWKQSGICEGVVRQNQKSTAAFGE